MKKIVLTLMVMFTVFALAAMDVTLLNGKEYHGDLLSSQENRVVLQDDRVVIQIPAEQVKTIMDNGQDVTNEILARATLGQATDIHYIEDDDFFVSEAALDNNSSVPVKTAKMINPPTQSSKMQAQFILTGDGTQVLTKNYYTTKVAKLTDLKLGTIVICFESNVVDGILKGPNTEEEKRIGRWIMTKVTNLSDVTNGYIMVSNDLKVDMDNIRIITK